MNRITAPLRKSGPPRRTWPTECLFCSKWFIRYNTEFESHVYQHTGERPFNCQKCDRNYSSMNALTVHTKTHLGEAGKIHQCNLCTKRFFNTHRLHLHLTAHTGERPHKCSICGRGFGTVDTQRNHERTHDDHRHLKCPECTSTFRFQASFRKHLETHKQRVGCPCPHCGKMLISKQSLRLHVMRAHDANEMRIHVCIFCEKQFKFNSDLFSHIPVHIKEKPVNCDLCAMEFFTLDVKNEHLRRHHTMERPHKCDLCEMRFFKKCEMTRHRTVHTVHEKLFKCGYCEASFRMHKNRRGHERRMHWALLPANLAEQSM